MTNALDGDADIAAAGDGRRVVLHTRVVAGRGGGPEKTILASPAYFRATPYRVVAAYIHPYDCSGYRGLEAAAERAGCELISIAERGPVDPRTVTALLRICRRYDVTIWHGHDYKSNLLGLLLRRFHRMRLVTTLHGWVDLDLRTKLYFALDRMSLRAYERVFCVSGDLADAARRCGVPAERISMLRNGVDGEDFQRSGSPASAPMRAALGVAPDRRVVAVIARLAPVKGIDLILEAFARVASDQVDSELWIAGDGPERAALEGCAVRLGLGERVRFLGFQEDVRPVLEASDIAVSASWREGTPNALLEAMAMEVPVIAADVGGVGALVRDEESGLRFAAGDVEGLATELRRLLNDAELRERLALAGRELVRWQFSLAERMRIEAAAYDRLLP